MTKKILILSESFLGRDPRVQVQIEALKSNYDLTCCGLEHPGIVEVEFIPFQKPYGGKLSKLVDRGWNRIQLKLLMQARKYELRYFKRKEIVYLLNKLKRRSFDLILCNDVNLLPLAGVLKEEIKTPLYLDAHEYTPRQFDGDRKFQPLLGYWDCLVRKFACKVDLMTTICESIAKEYEREFGLVTSNLIYNAPFSCDLHPNAVNENKIRMIHHGGLNRNRTSESMIELMDFLDERFHLEFMLIDNMPEYLRQFKARASQHPRITFRDPVPTRDIPQAINQYDIGLFLLDPKSFNYRNALPNKFFEFIQGRLAIAIWPSHEMKRITEQYDLGVVADEFNVEAMARKLNALDSDSINRFKQHSDRAATDYTAENSMSVIQSNVSSLIGN